MAAAPALAIASGAVQGGAGAHIGSGVDVQAYRRVRDTLPRPPVPRPGHAPRRRRPAAPRASTAPSWRSPSRPTTASTSSSRTSGTPGATSPRRPRTRRRARRSSSRRARSPRPSPPSTSSSRSSASRPRRVRRAHRAGRRDRADRARDRRAQRHDQALRHRRRHAERPAWTSATCCSTGSPSSARRRSPTTATAASRVTFGATGHADDRRDRLPLPGARHARPTPGGRLGALQSLSNVPGGEIDSYRLELGQVATSLAERRQRDLRPRRRRHHVLHRHRPVRRRQPRARRRRDRRHRADRPDAPSRATTSSRSRSPSCAATRPTAPTARSSPASAPRCREATRNEANAQALTDAVQDRRESVAGVSLDEEMGNLIRFQRAYQASSRAMSTMDEMLDVLINRTGTGGAVSTRITTGMIAAQRAVRPQPRQRVAHAHAVEALLQPRDHAAVRRPVQRRARAAAARVARRHAAVPAQRAGHDGLAGDLRAGVLADDRRARARQGAARAGQLGLGRPRRRARRSPRRSTSSSSASRRARTRPTRAATSSPARARTRRRTRCPSRPAGARRLPGLARSRSSARSARA